MAFNNCFKGKKIVITGNTGFKGSWLTVWLLKMGAEIVGISKDIPTHPSLFEELELGKKIQHHYINICDKSAMNVVIQDAKPDFVFHLAAQPIVSISYDDPLSTFETNVMGTANVLECLRSLTNPCIAVMITSDKCYDNVEWIWGYRETDALGGRDPYSASKGAAELVIKTYYHSYFSKPDSKVTVIPVRAGNVIGGGDWALNRIVPDCVRAWSATDSVKIRNPHSTRPWQHVLEPLGGYLRVAEVAAGNPGKLNGEAFNFGPNASQNHSVIELLEKIRSYWHFEDNFSAFEIEPSNKFHEAGLLKLNCDKALALLQWNPVLNFEETARFTGTWYDHYYNGSGKDYFDYTIAQVEEYEKLAKIKDNPWAV